MNFLAKWRQTRIVWREAVSSEFRTCKLAQQGFEFIQCENGYPAGKVLEIRAQCDYREPGDMTPVTGELVVVRTADYSLVFVAEPERAVRFGYRMVDMENRNERIVGDAGLFQDDLSEQYERARRLDMARRGRAFFTFKDDK